MLILRMYSDDVNHVIRVLNMPIGFVKFSTIPDAMCKPM